MMTVLTVLGGTGPAALILVAVLSLAYWADDAMGSRTGFTILAALAFGILLQRSRFCFLCILRDFHDRRDASGLVGILAAAQAVGQWRPTRPRLRLSLTAMAGGVLLGWGHHGGAGLHHGHAAVGHFRAGPVGMGVHHRAGGRSLDGIGNTEEKRFEARISGTDIKAGR